MCWDELREVYRIHGRWAARLPARLFGIRREAVTDMTASGGGWWWTAGSSHRMRELELNGWMGGV